MTDATTIDPAEAAHFGTLAADWWNPKGSSAMLHRLNPVRLGEASTRPGGQIVFGDQIRCLAHSSSVAGTVSPLTWAFSTWVLPSITSR